MTTLKKLISLSLLLWLATLAAQSQTYTVDWHKVAGGGGTSSNGQFVVSGTIGQHDASGPMAGGNYSVTGGFWALYAVQTPGAPTLFITQSGNQAILSWSASATGYLLENKTNLRVPNGWSSVPITPTTLNGFNYVTNTIGSGMNFYRLHHP